MAGLFCTDGIWKKIADNELARVWSINKDTTLFSVKYIKNIFKSNKYIAKVFSDLKIVIYRIVIYLFKNAFLCLVVSWAKNRLKYHPSLR